VISSPARRNPATSPYCCAGLWGALGLRLAAWRGRNQKNKQKKELATWWPSQTAARSTQSQILLSPRSGAASPLASPGAKRRSQELPVAGRWTAPILPAPWAAHRDAAPAARSCEVSLPGCKATTFSSKTFSRRTDSGTSRDAGKIRRRHGAAGVMANTPHEAARVSQNHRMVGVGRDLWSPSPTPCPSRVTYSRL